VYERSGDQKQEPHSNYDDDNGNPESPGIHREKAEFLAQGEIGDDKTARRKDLQNKVSYGSPVLRFTLALQLTVSVNMAARPFCRVVSLVRRTASQI